MNSTLTPTDTTTDAGVLVYSQGIAMDIDTNAEILDLIRNYTPLTLGLTVVRETADFYSDSDGCEEVYRILVTDEGEHFFHAFGDSQWEEITSFSSLDAAVVVYESMVRAATVSNSDPIEGWVWDATDVRL